VPFSEPSHPLSGALRAVPLLRHVSRVKTAR
jgi:hypothetical protein